MTSPRSEPGPEPTDEVAAARARLEAARRELEALEARQAAGGPDPAPAAQPRPAPGGAAADRAVEEAAAPVDGAAAAAADAADDAEYEPTEAELAARRAEVTEATTSVFRTALRGMLVLVAVVTVAGAVVGQLLSGPAGVWGALLGAAVTLVFSGTTVVSMLKTTQTTPQTLALVVLGGWIVKMFVLLGVLLVLRGADFYDRNVFVVVLLVGAIGSAFLDYRAVARGRVPYVVPPMNG